MTVLIDARYTLPRDPQKAWPRKTRPVDSIVVHHTATSPAHPIEGIARYHLSKGHPSIQYHYVIDKDGQVFLCNDDDLCVYHAGFGEAHYESENNRAVGVAFIGDFTRSHPTEAQLAAFNWLRIDIDRRLGGVRRILGHKEGYRVAECNPTACPGDTFDEWRGGLLGSPSPGLALLSPNPYALVTVHAQRYMDYQARWCREIGSRRAKIVNPPEGSPLFEGVPILDVRFWEAESWQWDTYISQGYEGGVRHVRDLAPRLARIVHPNKVLEVSNEPKCSNGQELALLNGYWLGCLDEADRLGIQISIGHIPEGNPRADEGLEGEAARASERWKLEQIVEAIKVCAERGQTLGWHAYWHPKVEGPTGRWHSLGRVSWTIEQLLAMGVCPSLRVAISEFGIDGLILQRIEGWRALSTPEIYRQELLEAESYARTIPQIDSLDLFTVGWEPPWEPYDHDEAFLRTLIDPVRAIAGGSPQNPQEPQNPQKPIPPDELAADWIAHARSFKLRYNPGAALRQIIEMKGFEVKSDEWYEGSASASRAYQWGLDRKNLIWHLFRWTPAEGPVHIYSEPVQS